MSCRHPDPLWPVIAVGAGLPRTRSQPPSPADLCSEALESTGDARGAGRCLWGRCCGGTTRLSGRTNTSACSALGRNTRGGGVHAPGEEPFWIVQTLFPSRSFPGIRQDAAAETSVTWLWGRNCIAGARFLGSGRTASTPAGPVGPRERVGHAVVTAARSSWGSWRRDCAPTARATTTGTNPDHRSTGTRSAQPRTRRPRGKRPPRASG